MGFIADLAKDFPGQNRGRAVWQEMFGTDKEREPPPKVRAGGAWDRTALANPEAYMRLLQAMRSMAPGGWSDDRWEQTRSGFTGIGYVAIHRISQQLAQSEFEVVVEDPKAEGGERPVEEGEDAYALVELLEKPNPQDHWGTLVYRWSQQKRLTGMALTWMVPNAMGTPMELYSIPTAIAIPQPAINPDYPHGYYRIQPVYPYGPFSSYPTPATAVGAPIPAQWMLRFLYPHPLLRYDGFSPLTGVRLHMDEATAIDRSRWYKMQGTLNPSAVLKADVQEGAQPVDWTEVERIRAEMENTHQRPENHGKLFVTQPGYNLEEWGATAKEMDYPQSWEQLISFILGGGFGITKQAAGMIEDSSYSTLFATLKQLHLITLEPDCNDIAQDLTRHLAPFFGKNLKVKIRCKRIDDHEIVGQKVDKMVAGKLGTVNEARKLLGLPKSSEEWGEERLGSDAAQPGMEGIQGEKPESPEDVIKAAEAAEPAKGPTTIETTGVAKRPTPGPLGRGSLGPRKSLKSFYELVREAISNGSSPLNRVKSYDRVRKVISNGNGH